MDRNVLIQLYSTTDGKSWACREGWAENAIDLGSWFGVTLNEKGCVERLELQGDVSRKPSIKIFYTGINMYGTLPPDLGRLESLRMLTLTGNKLHGPIPPELSQLINLQHLDISFNKLEGRIPPELGMLEALVTLHLERNFLAGPIPRELGQLANLRHLNLSFNKLQGRIPQELGKLVMLVTLNLERNYMAGSIPSELGNLIAFKDLCLRTNELSGPIPPELGNLVALKKLALNSNKLSGAIPPELGKLVALETLHLKANKLTGSIPPELGKLVALEDLRLIGNELTGSIPPELSNLVALEDLDLIGNELTGPIPPELGNMEALEALDLSDNRLTGAIPPELGKLDELEVLDLSDNQLTGAIPPAVGKMATLRMLNLTANKLTDLGDVEDALALVQRSTSQKGARALDLRLENNPWVMPPEAVVERGLVAVEKYLVDVREAKNAGAPVKTHKLLKVVLVGSSQAGKTSLMHSIVHGKASRTEGSPEEVSTVGIELRRHQLKGVKVEFYDCAGQIDYAGMHQTFLSRRSLFLLVWDVKKCHGKYGPDLDRVISEDIMPWLFALSLRVPESTVMLVANKCDGSVDTFSDIVQTCTHRAGELLKGWQHKRGISGRAARRLNTLNILPKASMVSCDDGLGLSDLTNRVAGQGATSISVPPMWNLALTVLGALRDKKSPLSAAREYLNLSSSHQDSVESAPSSFLPKKDLVRQWEGVLRSLRRHVDSRSPVMTLSNSDSALEGGLWISEFAGQVLRVDDGDGIFLDVVWLSKILNPILDHNLHDMILPNAQLNTWRGKLLNTGVLRWGFARYLWGDVFREDVLESSLGQLEKALFDVLVKLGVIIPLGRSILPPFRGSAWPTFHEEGGNLPDMLVLRWLRVRLSESEQVQLDSLLEEKLQEGAKEVTLKWLFDSAGPPHGLIGRLMASCHVIGEPETGLCWRDGALFKGHFVARETDRPYVVLVSYNSDERVLSVKVFGPLENKRVWIALRFMASLMVNVSKEWSGMLWEGWLECAKHPRDRVQLATPTEARIGKPLLPPTSRGCDCLRNTGGVLGQAVARLGNLMDTRSGDPFKNVVDTEQTRGLDQPYEAGGYQPQDDTGNIRPLEEAEALQPPEEAGDNQSPDETGDTWWPSCGDAFSLWLPHAWGTTTLLLGSAFSLFVASVALVEIENTLWRVCMGVVGLMTLGGVASAYFACRQMRANVQRGIQRDIRARDVAHIA